MRGRWEFQRGSRGVPAASRCRGTLRLSVPVFVAERVLPPVLARFTAAHPGVHFDVHGSDDRRDAVTEAYDVALRLALGGGALVRILPGWREAPSRGAPAPWAGHAADPGKDRLRRGVLAARMEAVAGGGASADG